MKIVPKNNGRCLLVVEELLALSAWRDQEDLITVVNDSGASRKSYNEWLFPDLRSAEEFMLLYKLKYEN